MEQGNSNKKRSDPDRRDTRRVRIARRAHVVDPASGARIECILRDASAGGCKLVTSLVPYLPNHVRLEIDGIDGPIDGTIAWRDGKIAGMRFDRLLARAPEGEPAGEQAADKAPA